MSGEVDPYLLVFGQTISLVVFLSFLLDCDYFMSIGEVDYKINNGQLAKDLGVTFDPKLNINHHIYEVTHKATKILGILMQTFLLLNKKTFILLYRSFGAF